MGVMKSEFVSSLFRKKTFDENNVLQTNLKRCLNVFDVTALAIGQMLGAGIYVLAGRFSSLKFRIFSDRLCNS